MEPLFPQLAGSLIVLVLCAFVGFAPARLLLPTPLSTWFWLCVPVIGYAVTAVLLGWISIFLPMQAGVWALVGAGAVMNGAVLVRQRGNAMPPGQAWGEQSGVGILAVFSCLLALAPLWDRPDLLAIGPNWDIEIYLPMAAYLREFAMGFSLADPAGFPFAAEPNPLLWRVNFFDPRWSGLAFSQLHAAVGSLTGQEPHQNFPGVLAATLALSVPATFLFMRNAVGLPGRLSFLACGLLAVSPVMLHTVFWSFGQQASAFPLLPMALLTGVQALLAPSVRWFILAGLFLAAMLASFIPVVPLYALAMGSVALLLLLRRTPPVGMLARGVSILAVSLLLAPWAYLRGMKRLYHFMQEGGTAGLTAGPDISAFPQLLWLLGLADQPQTATFDAEDLLPPLVHAGPLLLTAMILALIAIGMLRLVRRGKTEATAATVGALTLLLAFRFAVPYPYGFLKVLPHVQFLLIALAFAGMWALWGMFQGRTAAGLALRACVVAIGLATVGTTLFSAGNLTASMRAQSYSFYRDVEALETLVPPGASVMVSGDKSYEGPKAAVLAYFLRHARLFGYVRTGFSTFYRPPDRGLPDYAIYGATETVPSEVFGATDLVWEGAGVKLYRKDANLLAYQDLSWPVSPPLVQKTTGYGLAAGIRVSQWLSTGYPDFTAWSPPMLGVLSETAFERAAYPAAQPASTLNLTLPQGDEADNMAVTVATFRPGKITVSLGDPHQEITVSPGVSSYLLPAAKGSGQLSIRNIGGAVVYIKSLTLWNSASPRATERFYPTAIVARWQARQAARGMTIDLDYLNAGFQPVLDIYSKDGRHHYGYWQLPSAADGASFEAELRLLRAAGKSLLMTRQGRQTDLQGWQGEQGDGEYVAYLFFWDGEQVQQSAALCTFTITNGAVLEVSQVGSGMFIG